MVLAGLERLDRGEIHIAGEPLHSLSEDALAYFRGRNIGIVFPSFHLIANMTALETVAVQLELANVRDPFVIARRDLAAVGLTERITHSPGKLYAGEQQGDATRRAPAPSPPVQSHDAQTRTHSTT